MKTDLHKARPRGRVGVARRAHDEAEGCPGQPGEQPLETPTVTAERWRALAALYAQGQGSALRERTVAQRLRQEADVCQGQLRQFQADLRAGEPKY